MKKILASLLAVVLLAAMFVIPASALTWEDGQTQNENGIYTFSNAYGYVFKVNSVNGVIAGEDATVITTNEKYAACNATWAITVVLDKVSDNVYAVNKVVECPGANGGDWVANANVTLDSDTIALVVHSAGSLPSDDDGTYPNWEAKVAAMALKAGDKITLAGIDLAAGTVNNGTATVETKEDAPAAETIVIDGDINDTGWSHAESDFTLVNPENGFWQAVPTTDATIEYLYQLRSDGEKLYVLVAANCALKAGGNGAGTNIRLWIRTNDDATVYTHFFDVYAGGFDAKKCGSLTENKGATVVTSEVGMEAAIGEIEGQDITVAEFAFDLEAVGATDTLEAFFCVSNKPAEENVCLYYPPVTEGESRTANLPYNKWDADNDLEIAIADILLAGSTIDGGDGNVVIVNKNVAAGKTYTTSGIYADANGVVSYPDEDGKTLTDGINAPADAAYGNIEFVGFNKGTEAYTADGYAAITVDLADKYDLTKFVLKAGSKMLSSGITAPATVSVYVSDDNQTWTAAGEVAIEDIDTAATVDAVITLNEAVNAQYVQFRFTANTNWMFVAEVEAYADVAEIVDGDNSGDNSGDNGSSSTPSTPVKPGDASNAIVFAIVAIVAIAGSAVVIKTRR